MGPALAAGAIESFGEAAFVEECLFEGSELAVEKEIRLIDQADQGVGRVEDDLRDLIGLQVVVAAMRGNDPRLLRPMSPISPICPIPLSSPLHGTQFYRGDRNCSSDFAEQGVGSVLDKAGGD